MSTTALALLVVIRLYDAAGTPAREVRAAIDTTTATLRSARVGAEWIVCSAPHQQSSDSAARCDAPPAAADLIVRIMRTTSPGIGGETLGDAAVDKVAGRGRFATVYANRIDRLAADAGVDRGVLLGRAIAHEVGHLLLGTTTHPPRGLMRAKWASADLAQGTPRDWLFSPAEARILRRRVADSVIAETR